MRGSTHLLFGLILSWIAVDVVGVNDAFVTVALILLASLLPDIDERTSTLGRKVKLVGLLSKHRSFFHSIFFLVICMVLLSIFLQLETVYWFALAYLLHLLLDALTPMGVRPFWPSELRIKGFVRVGSVLEKLIFVATLIIFLHFLLG